jgi:N-acetylglucosamine kinase-like BadF-type ATPase
MSTALGLGIDAGGTQTRWALAAPPGTIVAEGAVRGMSALQLHEGVVGETLSELASAALAHGRPARVYAGFTGLGRDVEPLRTLIGEPLDLAPDAVTVTSDIDIAYRDIFSPGEGYVVYAGTGSVVAFIDASGALHRAGGRGVALDDGGGGYWIAREALRHIWRADDEEPDGAWRDSPLAIALFEQIGGAGWSHTHRYVYGGDRGDMGRLALAVAKAAGEDPVAREILAAAGRELARLALVMTRRHGPRPVALTGRAAQLHPLIFESMRATIPPATQLDLRVSSGHHAAARLALRAAQRSQPA